MPIKDIKEINLIKEFCRKKNKIRELLMFTLSINTGIELTDLLNLKVKDVKDKLYLKILNTKTVPLNNELIELINIAIDGKKDLELLFNGC